MPETSESDANPEEETGDVEITAMAGTPTGDAVVGGVARGPLKLGTVVLERDGKMHGFVARVSGAGSVKLIRLLDAEPIDVESWKKPAPAALVVDRSGDIVVSGSTGRLTKLHNTSVAWQIDSFPRANSIALSGDGDLLVAGCSHGRLKSEDNAFRPLQKEGYVARVAPNGKRRWTYRFRSQLEPLSDHEDCGTSVVAGPSGSTFVAGTFSGIPSEVAATSHWSESGTFVARMSRDGQLLWSRLVPLTHMPAALASTSGGHRVVVAGRTSQPWGDGLFLRALDEDGKELWSLSADKAPGSNGWLGESVVASQGKGVVWMASFNQVIQVGSRVLRPGNDRAGGIVVATVDADGALLSIDDVTLKPARATPPLDALTPVALSETRGHLWMAARVDAGRRGAFLGLVGD